MRVLLDELNTTFHHSVYAIFVGDSLYAAVMEGVRSDRWVRQEQLYLSGIRVIPGNGHFNSFEWLAVGYGLVPLMKGDFGHGT